uniref:Chitin-binding type-2 domain-containing protein n=1 Tax=Anopheles epiroticus TaxID=199890 RepID=A0A182PRX1_9DIPT
MLKFAAIATVGLLVVAVQCVKVDYYGSLYNPKDELHAPYHEKEDKQDFSKIPGVPGVDYPIYHEVPHTSFHCGNVPAIPGMYANVETGCQAYHTCHDGREGHQGASFLCTNGTLFNQKEFACDWWYNVKCEDAPSYYHLNADPEHNPFTPKRKPEEEEHQHHKKFLIHV